MIINKELHEHRIVEVIRQTCDRLGVRMVSLTPPHGKVLTFFYDRHIGLRVLRKRAVTLTIICHLVFIASLCSCFLLNEFRPWLIGLAWTTSVITTIHTLRINQRQPITQQELEWEINHALERMGYATNTRGERRNILLTPSVA